MNKPLNVTICRTYKLLLNLQIKYLLDIDFELFTPQWYDIWIQLWKC